MTPREFIIWLKGFAQSASDFTLTPKQWDDLKDQLDKVEIDDSLQKVTKLVLDKNSSISFSNPGTRESDITYGRPQDLITYTTK